MNIDFALYINKKSVIHYLNKYTFKKKKKFDKLVNINKNIFYNLLFNAFIFI